MKAQKILDRILKKSGIPNLLGGLVNRLSLPDLQSLLMEVYRQRVLQRTPADLLKQYQQNRFVKLSEIDPRSYLAFDQLAYSLLSEDFVPLELSPLAPLGANSTIAAVDPTNAVATVRNTEVCSDNTNVMALECALRRRQLQKFRLRVQEWVRLASSHRLVRPQLYNFPGVFAHFRVFSLCSAGRDKGHFGFEVGGLLEHIDFYVRLLKNSEKLHCPVQNIIVKLTILNPAAEEMLEKAVLQLLAKRYPDVTFRLAPERESGRNYYQTATFQIDADTPEGETFFLVDGGFTDWTAQLLSNRKERLMISGFGSERFLWGFQQND